MHVETGELRRIFDEEELDEKARQEALEEKYEIMSREEALSKGFVEVPKELNESALEAMKIKTCAFNSNNKPLRDFAKNTRRKIKLKRRMVKKSRRKNRK